MRGLTFAIVLLGMLVVTPSTYAMWGWMRGAALGEFTDADWEILKATSRSTLDTSADGEQVNWRNEETGNKGAMKAIMTFRYEGQTCRRIAFLNISHKGQRGVTNYNLCQQADETWAFVADSAITARQE